jgi:Lipoprotein LpqB beta-propeller domain
VPGAEAYGATRVAVSSASPLAQIAFDAPPEVRAALEALGRTEDVRFAPSGRRLALAAYRKDRIAVADVEITVSASGPKVAVTRLEQIASSSLREPHGLDFLDEETLVVGNRRGGVVVLRLPSAGSAESVTWVEPLCAVGEEASDGPGSVLVESRDPGRRGVLVCNNFTSTITRHAVEPGWALGAAEVVARRWIDLPDGLALSRDGRLLATSNHNSHSVLVHAYPTAGDDDDPVGVLRGVLYPHGLRFSADDRYLLVADAGRPYVRVFASPGDGWRDVGYPRAAIRVMDDETFARGQLNPQEGGPKGIDIHPHTNVLAVTAECLPLAFFDVDAALEQDSAAESDDLVQYELYLLAEKDAMKAAAAEDRSQLMAKISLLRETVDRMVAKSSNLGDVQESSRSKRVTKPLRAVTARLRHLRPR